MTNLNDSGNYSIALRKVMDYELASATFHKIIHEAKTHRAIASCYNIIKLLKLVRNALPCL